jgi:YD repeat-containing protein
MVYGAPDDPNPGNRGRLLRRTEEPTNDLSGEKGFAAVTTGPARTTAFTYDARGRVIAVDGPRTDASDVTRTTYHADDDADLARRGRVATLTNALGHVTRIDAYDAHGQPLVVVAANGTTTTYTYDARQRLVASKVSGELTTYGYDAAGLMTETVLPTGGRVLYGYDPAGRLVEVRDSLGDRVAYTLDAEGHRVLEEVFDPSGTLTVLDRRGYDALGRQVSETRGDATTSVALDGAGNVVQTTDPLGRVTTMTYDALGRAVATTLPPVDAAGARPVSTANLEPGGATAGVTDLRGLATAYEPDGFGAVTSTASPDSGTTRRSFDEAGNLLSSVDALGRVTTYAHDALGRVTRTSYGAATGKMLGAVDFGYDAGALGVGRLTSVLETAADGTVVGRTTFVHDARGRVVAETNEVGVSATTTYRYGATTGALERMTYPSGRAVDFELDTFGRLVSARATSPDGTVQSLATGARYAPFGGLVGFSLGNGQAVDLPRDLQGRIRAYTLGSQRIDVGYDAAGRVTGLTNAADPAGARAYAYDGLDRLVQALLPARTVSFEYDTNGNRTKRTNGAVVEASTIDATSNRVLEVIGGAGARFGYDAAGSMIVQGATTHAYDARGRLVSSTTGGVTTTYQFDARGHRVRKAGQRDTVFQYDTRGSLIAELSPTGATRREYYYLGDRMIAVMVQP